MTFVEMQLGHSLPRFIVSFSEGHALAKLENQRGSLC